MANRKPKTHAVRVRIREVPHMVLTEDMLGNPAVTHQSGFGPGRPEIEPYTLLGIDVDVESDEFKAAAEDYKKGQLIYLLDDDYMRLKNAGAVMDADDVDDLIVQQEEEEVDISAASVDELAEWITTEKPNVGEVVGASGGVAEYAQKLLEAESQAHEGEPRDGVVKGLTAVISRG